IGDVNHRCFAGPVLAHQRVDLGRAHLEVDVVVGDHPGKSLGDAAHRNVDVSGGGRAHSEPDAYGMPSAAGGVLRPTRPASTTTVIRYGSMLNRYCETWMVELLA